MSSSSPTGARQHGVLDRREHARTDQDLPPAGARAEAAGEIRHRPEGTVVVAAFEPDPSESRISGLDSDAEPELGSALPPPFGQLGELLLGREREPDGLELMVLEGDRVVEEDHHPVACEMLEGAAERGDQLAQGLVVLAEHVEELLGRGRLGKGGEAAQVAEEAR